MVPSKYGPPGGIHGSMKSKAIGPRAFILVFDRGDKIVATLTEFAIARGLSGAYFNAIGACSGATIAYFNAKTNQYDHTEITEFLTVLDEPLHRKANPELGNPPFLVL